MVDVKSELINAWLNLLELKYLNIILITLGVRLVIKLNAVKNVAIKYLFLKHFIFCKGIKLTNFFSLNIEKDLNYTKFHNLMLPFSFQILHRNTNIIYRFQLA